MSARIPEIGPVTYVFLGRINARLLLARFTDYFKISTLVAPLTYSAYASTPSVLQPPVATTNLETIPKSGIILQSEWLEMVLNGRKTWELRTMKTNKRERVALAQSGTSLLLGDVEITGCVELDDIVVRANIESCAQTPHFPFPPQSDPDKKYLERLPPRRRGLPEPQDR